MNKEQALKKIDDMCLRNFTGTSFRIQAEQLTAHITAMHEELHLSNQGVEHNAELVDVKDKKVKQLQAEIDRLKGECWLPDEAIVTPFITHGQGQDITSITVHAVEGFVNAYDSKPLFGYKKQGDKWLLQRGEEDE